MLLTKCGKDKVRIRDGQKVALGLAAVLRALAPDAAGADGDEGLSNLVTAAARVVIRSYEAGEALLLIRLQYLVPGGDDLPGRAPVSPR